jgi:LAO/AO transport system kinase
MTLAAKILQGDRMSLARVLTQIENETVLGLQALNELYTHTGKAHLIGVTGPPGTGKSSLVNQLARFYRGLGEDTPKRVGIVAVDPSSPFTGGAILGDRVRMRDLAGDKDVFIRSMASRGSLGGLAVATSGVVQAMDAAGYEVIFIETVGAGQAEVEIARLADTVLVVEAPGMGDDIQAIKAGILEIADVIVINKADRPGVETTTHALRSMLQLAHPNSHLFMDSGNSSYSHSNADFFAHHEAETDTSGFAENPKIWTPPLEQTVATEGIGIADLARTIQRHYEHLKESGELARRLRVRVETQLDVLLRERLIRHWQSQIAEEQYRETVDKLMRREISPWQAADNLIDR